MPPVPSRDRASINVRQNSPPQARLSRSCNVFGVWVGGRPAPDGIGDLQKILEVAMRKTLVALAVSAIAVSVAPAMADQLNGAGGTAIYPVLSKWADSYQKSTG